MKRKNKVAVALCALFLIGAPFYLTGCGEEQVTPPIPTPPGPEVTYGDVLEFSAELSSTKPIAVGETISVVAKVVSPENAEGNFSFSVKEGSESIISVNSNGLITGLAQGTGTVVVTCNTLAEEATMDRDLELTVVVSGTGENAVGAYNFAASSYEDKLEILGKLEEYAIENHLTGITLFESGGYVMYASRIEKPTNTYISGYGFGTLTEGRITAANDYYTEEGTEWYYHSYAGTANKENFNYLDDTGSESADLYGYVSSNYYSTRMNATRDGYEWYPLLANTFDSNDPDIDASTLTTTQLNRPVALNKDAATGLATQYRIYLKTGYDYENGQETLNGEKVAGDGLVYHTSTKSRYHGEFDGRPVSIMDYVTPYQLLLNGNIGLARSTDMRSDSSSGTLRGAQAYYNSTRSNADIEGTEDTFFNLVGIDVGLDDDPSSPDAPCITLTLNQPISEFDAMYSLSSSLVSPISKDFIKRIAFGNSGSSAYDSSASYTTQELANFYRTGMKKAYGTANKTVGTTPVDNLLSVGPFILDASESSENIYSRNDDFEDNFDGGRYDVEGVVLHYNSKMADDTNAAFNEFIEYDAYDAVSIPQDFLDKYRDDPRTTISQGDSTFKLNINSCTQEEWNAIFGDGGENPNGGLTWQCEPLMSNDNFIDALSLAIDRVTYANNRGSVPSQDYFADAYLWQPEEGLSYNETTQHLGNIADYSPETYGYNLDAAVALMDAAITEEIRKGSYTGYNTTIDIDTYWMNTTDPRDYGDDIESMWNEAFQQTDAYRNGFRINFNQIEGTTNYQDVYTSMRQGRFDLGFGSISGMTLDPLGFLEVLKSNNDAGFTLNYSGSTSVVNEEAGKFIYYNGEKWSYDGLWEAANIGAIIGSDTRVVENPLTLGQGGNTSAAANWNGTPSRQLTLRYTVDTNAVGATMRFATNDEETLTIGASYRRGTGADAETVAVSFSLRLADYCQVLNANTAVEVTAELNKEASSRNQLVVYIPSTITSTLTNLEYDIPYDELTDVYVYVNYYTTIGNYTSGRTLTVSAKL